MLGLDTKEGLKKVGITEDIAGDSNTKLLDNPGTLTDKSGFLRGINGTTISPEDGAQIKILIRHDSAGKPIGIVVMPLMSNDNEDTPTKDKEADLTMHEMFAYVLEAVKNFATANGISGKDILFTGISNGGATTNAFHKHRNEIAGGYFRDAVFVGFASPTMSNDASGKLFNLGFENDPVYGMWEEGVRLGLSFFQDIADKTGNQDFVGLLKEAFADVDKNRGLSKFRDLVKEHASLFDDKKYFVKSGPNNLVSYDDGYVNTLGLGGKYSNSALDSWVTHGLGLLSNAAERIYKSVFHEKMNLNSVIILSNLLSLTRPFNWVWDKPSGTSDHFGQDAFILGTDHRDLLKDGSANDALEGRGGNDWFWLSMGKDLVAGGDGHDKVTLEGHSSDYVVTSGGNGISIYKSDLYGEKTLHDVEEVHFLGDEGGSLGSDRIGDWYKPVDIKGGLQVLGDAGRNRLDGDISNDIINGYGDDDILKGLGGNDAIDGGDGNDGLFGGNGDDRINGGTGNDRITGGRGVDTLTGGTGSDTFRFGETRGWAEVFGNGWGYNNDVITDFNRTAGEHDVLSFSSAIYATVADVLKSARETTGGVVVGNWSGDITLQGWNVADFTKYVTANPGAITIG
jgi:Ca2+-binding RTX toxin-like protein